MQKLRRIRVKIHELRQLHLPQPVQHKLVVQLPQEEMLVNMIRQFQESLTGKPPAQLLERFSECPSKSADSHPLHPISVRGNINTQIPLYKVRQTKASRGIHRMKVFRFQSKRPDVFKERLQILRRCGKTRPRGKLVPLRHGDSHFTKFFLHNPDFIYRIRHQQVIGSNKRGIRLVHQNINDAVNCILSDDAFKQIGKPVSP